MNRSGAPHFEKIDTALQQRSCIYGVTIIYNSNSIYNYINSSCNVLILGHIHVRNVISELLILLCMQSLLILWNIIEVGLRLQIQINQSLLS